MNNGWLNVHGESFLLVRRLIGPALEVMEARGVPVEEVAATQHRVVVSRLERLWALDKAPAPAGYSSIRAFLDDKPAYRARKRGDV